MDHLISTAVGTQWVGDFAKCQCDAALLKHSAILEAACEKIANNVLGNARSHLHSNGGLHPRPVDELSGPAINFACDMG